jgi:hypothetical protein
VEVGGSETCLIFREISYFEESVEELPALAKFHDLRMCSTVHWSFADENSSNCSRARLPIRKCGIESKKDTTHFWKGQGSNIFASNKRARLLCCVCLYSLSRKVLLRFDKGLKFAAALSSWPCTCSAGPLQNKAIWVAPVQSKFLTMAYFGVSYSNIFSYNSLVPPAPILCVLYIVLCIISTNREIDRDR